MIRSIKDCLTYLIVFVDGTLYVGPFAVSLISIIVSQFHVTEIPYALLSSPSSTFIDTSYVMAHLLWFFESE